MIVGFLSSWIFYLIEPHGELNKLPIMEFVTYDPSGDSDRVSEVPLSPAERLTRSKNTFSNMATFLGYLFVFVIWLPVTLIMYGRQKRRWKHHIAVGLPLISIALFLIFHGSAPGIVTFTWLAAYCLTLGVIAPSVFFLLGYAGQAATFSENLTGDGKKVEPTG